MCNKDTKCSDCKISRKLKSKKLKSKRRASPYIKWVTEQQNQRKEEFKNFSQSQKIQKLAKEWRAKKS